VDLGDGDRPRRTALGRDPDGLGRVSRRVDDGGRTLVVEIEGAWGPKEAVPRPDASLAVDLDPNHRSTPAGSSCARHQVDSVIAREATADGAPVARSPGYGSPVGGTFMIQHTAAHDLDPEAERTRSGDRRG
jgi:hypothetical protein